MLSGVEHEKSFITSGPEREKFQNFRTFTVESYQNYGSLISHKSIGLIEHITNIIV